MCYEPFSYTFLQKYIDPAYLKTVKEISCILHHRCFQKFIAECTENCRRKLFQTFFVADHQMRKYVPTGLPITHTLHFAWRWCTFFNAFKLHLQIELLHSTKYLSVMHTIEVITLKFSRLWRTVRWNNCDSYAGLCDK